VVKSIHVQFFCQVYGSINNSIWRDVQRKNIVNHVDIQV